MGATYTRQSSYTDGDTITAAHTNDEFNQLLAAFQASSGHTHDGTANEGGPITSLLGTSITIGSGTDSDITVTFNTNANDGVFKWMEDEDYFEFNDDILISDNEQLIFGSNSDIAISYDETTTDSLKIAATEGAGLAITLMADEGDDAGDEWKLNIADGGTLTFGNDIASAGSYVTHLTLTPNATVANSTLAVAGNLTVGGSITIGSAGISETELEILDGATVTTTELNLLDGVTASTSELNILDGVTSTASELNLVDGITAGTVSASKAVIVDSNKDISGFRNLSITGDLTVSGDDITMGTNTAGHLLIADGTNFNSIAVGDLSEISTVANDDVFLAVDTSGGGLKKIARSAIVSGLASSAAISNVVEDTSPQLGANLDTNSHNILIDDAHFIADENGNEQIIFQTTSSAVNQFDITNAATGNGPTLSATGSDTNINLNLTPKGSGVVQIDGSNGVSIDSGAISIKNSGSESYVRFYCESSNAHYVQLQAPAHSDFSGNHTVVLPNLASTLATTALTETLTNKSLTAPILTGSSSAAGSILFKEDTDNGTNAVTLIGPASTADVTVTLPNSAGTVALTSDIPSSGISSGNVATFTSGAADNDFLRIDGTSIEGRSASEVLSDIGGQASLTFGISNTNAVKIDSSSVADDEFARFTANGLESRSTSEVRSDLGLGTAALLDTGISNTNIAKFTSGVADNDFLRVDGTSIEGRSASEVLSDISAAPAAGDSNILTVGALDSGSITSGFGSIDIGSSALSTTGSVTLGATSFGDNNITNVGSIALDSIASDAGVGTAITLSAGIVPNTVTEAASGNYTPDMSQYTNFILTVSNSNNCTLQDPTDEAVGQSGIFVFIQDGTGGGTLSHADDRYHVAGGTSLVLSTGANDVDVVPYFVQADGTILLGAIQKDFVEA